jgi:hypothetical protein
MTARRNPLPSNVKRFIVMCLARHDTPLETALRVWNEFGIQLQRSTVAMYDPTTKGGRALSDELKRLFRKTRTEFEQEIETVPIAHRAVRLRRLDHLYIDALVKKDRKVQVAVLREARNEMTQFEVQDDGEDGDAKDST